MPDWDSMFGITVPLAELFLRGTCTYLLLLVAMRITGQRESGGLGLTDVLVVVLAANAATSGLTGGAESITEGGVVVVTILFWSVAVDAAAYRWPRFAAVVKARPRPLIRDGRVNRRAMHREYMSDDELLSQLRLQGIEDPADVHLALLEPNGHISVVRRAASDPEGRDDESDDGRHV